MRPALALVALSLLTPAAHAEVFLAENGFVHFCLTRAERCSAVEGDLLVSDYGVWARAGLKRASRPGRLQPLEVTALEEPYDVKDPSGGRWRMVIRSPGGVLQVNLVRARPQGRLPVQVLWPVSVQIQGAAAAPTFSKLTLYPDGHYELGGARGRYQRDEFGVSLDGVPATWGRAAYSVKDEGLVFRFLRGPLQYEVRYRLQVPAVS